MIFLEEKYINEYISDTLNDLKQKPVIVEEMYHHNSEYKHAPSICLHGILSLNELNKEGITNYSEEILRTMSDTDSHVNGSDAISLAKIGLTDIYDGEDIYNPLSPNLVDFIVSGDVKAQRTSIHYGNEYIVRDKIDISKLMAVDIRLLKLIEQNKINNKLSKETLCKIIENFNYLKDIANSIKKSNLEIPIRERSKDNLTLNVEKISKLEKIQIKK